MKMCGNDRRRYGKYNGNNENDNSMSLRVGIKSGFCLLLERKKGRVGFIYLPRGK